MTRSTDRFIDIKRHILVADDEMINREMLANILGDEYDVLMAEDGEQAYDIISHNRNTLSLILLDLKMPKLTGLELLSRIKEDPDIKGIPVTVLTSDQASEVESLGLGAYDFIPKPYPQPDVIKARISRSIELAEDRQIITATEKDALTGLFTSEYFYRYGEQFDKFHPLADTDAVCLDVKHFHVINERFGSAKGDEILKRIAGCLKSTFADEECVICRMAADIFLIYCTHRDDYGHIADMISESCEDMPTSVKIRIGVYYSCDKNLDLRARIARAKIASNKIHNNYTISVGEYDETLMDNELFTEQLVDEFPRLSRRSSSRSSSSPNTIYAGTDPSYQVRRRWYAGSIRLSERSLRASSYLCSKKTGLSLSSTNISGAVRQSRSRTGKRVSGYPFPSRSTCHVPRCTILIW